MSELSKIKEPVKEELREFEPYFRNTMKSKVPLLSIITNYIYRRKGKQLRSLLVFLFAGLKGNINRSTHVAAAMIELLHTATLIHDDVVDEAYERRGSFSINALWRSKVAVLVGDFLLSKGLLLAIDTGEYDLLKNMSNAVKDMSEGELLQIERSRKMNIDEKTYFDIIRKKTAALMAACVVNGVNSAQANEEEVDAAYEYGINLGLAFQIKDDIFDYQSKGVLGKPIGNDIKENKLTLPLIHSLSKVDRKTQKQVLKKLKQSKRNPKAVAEIISFTNDNGGIQYSVDVMNRFKDKAMQALSCFPDSEYKESLKFLTEFIVNRKS